MEIEPSRKHFHFCQSIEGALMNWDRSQWREVAKINKCSTDYLKDEFRKMLASGIEVLPLDKGCEGFDFVKGCPGHLINE